MNLEIKRISKANQLPDSWDDIAIDYFQTKQSLDYAEKYNPCSQRYYAIFKDNILKAGIVLYTLKLDLFTYLPFSVNIKMNIAGVPCSVSASGFIGDNKLLPELFDFIKTYEKGFLLFLNLDDKPGIRDSAAGKTLPGIIFRNGFDSWDQYLQALRSNYRRRINLISDSFTGIETTVLTCQDFTKEMHKQYLEVLKRSKGKLETLSLNFFQNLPSNFILTTFYKKSRLLGWHITLTFKDRFSFFLGGIDYEVNKQYNTYFNLLINILKDGIESGAGIIDLGQTAEIPKLRLGGMIGKKFMLASHSVFVLRKLLIAGSGILEYRNRYSENHVFKEEI